MKLIIGTNEYIIEQGMTFGERLDIELDLGSVMLKPQTAPLNVEPYTNAQIDVDGVLFYFVIAEIESNYTSVDTYDVKVQLIEETKYLEGIKMSSFKITQSTDPLDIDLGLFTSYKTQLERVRDIAPFEMDSLVATTRVFTLSSDFDSAAFAEKCPEKSFETPHLREALDGIVKDLNGCVRLKNGILYFEDFNTRGTQLSYFGAYGIDEIHHHHTMENYGAYAEINAKNMINESQPQQASKITGWLSLRPEELNLTSDNGYWDLGENEKIDSIIKVSLRCVGSALSELPDFTSLDLVIDITKYVKENSVYRLLTTAWATGTIYDGVEDYKASCITWDRYSNRIYNVFKVYKNAVNVTLEVAIRNVTRAYTIDNYVNVPITHWDNTPVKEYMIMVEYIPLQNERFRIRKNKVLKNIGISMNQSENSIDSASMGKNMRSVIERVGNEYITVDKDSININQRLKAGDWLYYYNKKWVITYVDHIVYTDTDIYSKAVMHENYQVISSRVGINQEKRQYAIEQTIERHEIYEEYAEAMIGSPTIEVSNAMITEVGILSFMQTFVGSPIVERNVKYALWKYGSPAKYVVLTANSAAVGDSLKFSFGFDNAVIAGNKIGVNGDDLINRGVPYASPSGQLETFGFQLFTEYNFGGTRADALTRSRELPEANLAYVLSERFISPVMRLKKDRSEVIKFVYQMHVKSRYEEMIVMGDWFFNNNCLVRSLLTNETRKIYVSTTRYMQLETKYAKGTYIPAATINIALTNATHGVVQVSDLPSDTTYWAIADGNGKLIMAVNSPIATVTFYFKNKRSIVGDMPIHYTVDFKVDTTVVKSESVLYGQNATAPLTAHKDPTATVIYTFSSWLGSYTFVTSNREILAQFTESVRTYTVRFINYDDVILKTEQVEYLGNATAPANPTRPSTAQYNYTFLGWLPSYTSITSNKDIFAQYDAILRNYTMQYRTYDDVFIVDQIIAYGSVSTPPTAPSRTGYTFDGWYTALSGGTKVTDFTVYHNWTVYSRYTINVYTVQYIDWDGSSLKTEYVEHGSYTTPPSNPTRATDVYYIYTFSGWNYDIGVPITSAQVITAQYSTLGVERTISFNANGGDTPSPTSKLVRYNTQYGTLASVSRTSYTFNGWYTATSGGTLITSTSTFTGTSNQTLYAQWTQSAPTVWAQTTTESTSPSADYNTGDVNCRTASDIKLWLDANYPVGNYALGVIFRVRVITSEATLCAIYYFRAE